MRQFTVYNLQTRFKRDVRREKSMPAAAASDNANSHRRRRVHLQPPRKCIRGCTGVPAVQAGRRREGKNTTASPSLTPRSARAVHSEGASERRTGGGGARPECPRGHTCAQRHPRVGVRHQGPMVGRRRSEGIFFAALSPKSSAYDVIIITIIIIIIMFAFFRLSPPPP